MSSHLFIFAFAASAFGVRSKKIIPKTDVKELDMFSSEFMVSGLMFKSLIHFEYIPVNGMQ